jgi:hypothetical protein
MSAAEEAAQPVPGEIISYLDMCRVEGMNLQRGMNYGLRDGTSVVLMSLRAGAPYADRVEEGGRVLVYEGHDEPRRRGGADPKLIDQPLRTANGSLTENGKFFEAVHRHKHGQAPAVVRVYEKIRSSVWVYNGLFRLVEAWQEESGGRSVCKFRLEAERDRSAVPSVEHNLQHTRIIPAAVVREVWKRDKGRCVKCGSTDNLHLDHLIPFSRGGSSLVADNIQLLCARHNLEKRDRIGF